VVGDQERRNDKNFGGGEHVILKRNLLAVALATGLCTAFGMQAAVAQTTTGTATQTGAAGTTTTAATTSNDTSTTTSNQKSQQALVKSLSTVTVTGFAGSVEKSIDYQRYADTIQNVVTAADIGGLPDQSIADALTRLPGVSAERIAGQASQINCRGLSGNFIETTLNGREQPSTSGTNYIQFDQYPSELINMATVYKTSQASLIEGGVGCTIAMETANPLDNKKDQSLNVDARGSYDGQAHDVTGANAEGYRLSVAYQGKFLDNTLGVGLGFAQLYQPHVSEQYVGEAANGSYAYLNQQTNTGPQAYIPSGLQLQQNGGEERRTGYLATVVWRPDDHWQITADSYYSKFDDTSFGYGFRSQVFNGGSAIVTNPIYGAGNTLTGGTVTGFGTQFSNETTADNDTTDTGVFSGGLNMKWNDGPWHVEADASLSHAMSNNINVDTTADPYNGLGTSSPTLMPQTTNFAFNGTRLGSASFANPGIYTNLNDMGLAEYGVYPYVYHDRDKGFRTSVQYDLESNSVFTDLQAGIYINNHFYDAQRTAWVYGDEYTGGGTAQPVLPLSSSDTSVVCWRGSFSGFPCFLKINAPAVLAAYGLVPNPQLDLNPSGQAWTGVESGTVSEKVRDLFFQADIDTTLWGHDLTGNVGIRASHTSQSSSGLEEVPTGTGVPMTDGFGYTSTSYDPINIGTSYTKWLPSLNLIYHWDDNDQTRFAVSKVLSRPTINYMLAGAGSYETSGTTFNVWGGYSPLLRPLTAMTYDLDYEHYFDNSSGLFTAGVFAKHVNTFIEQVTYNQFNFASIGITVPINPATGQPYLNGSYSTAFNAPGTTLRGFETSFQKTHFLPGFWSNFGVGANYAFTQSGYGTTTNLGGPSVVTALPGLSRNVASAQVFYDDGRFSGNITGTYRSKFVSDSQIAVTNQLVYFDSETTYDLQTAYKVTQNVSLLFQVLNLTNTPTRTYFGIPSNTGTLQWFGRTFYAGVNLSL
jgi:iron complex outermembrane recepter protein